MSITKNYKVVCDICGKFCVPFDEETTFGCNNPEYPEPLDPYHYCEKCCVKLKEDWLKKFKNGSRYGNWQKSKAELEAAKEVGLIWIGSNGIGSYEKHNHKNYCYVTQEEYNQLVK